MAYIGIFDRGTLGSGYIQLSTEKRSNQSHLFQATDFRHYISPKIYDWPFVPAPSNGKCLNPKGAAKNGTPTPIHLAPRKEGPGRCCNSICVTPFLGVQDPAQNFPQGKPPL